MIKNKMKGKSDNIVKTLNDKIQREQRLKTTALSETDPNTNINTIYIPKQDQRQAVRLRTIRSSAII